MCAALALLAIGSGKTFTITGGPEKYEDRGIIPRALSYIFAKLQAAGDTQYEVRVSYLEIYNEAGYDLLDPSHETKGLEDLAARHDAEANSAELAEHQLLCIL